MRCRIIRSNRKSLCLQITREGEVLVRAPRNCSERYIREFVDSKKDWIREHLETTAERTAARDAFRLTEGQTLTLCGEPFTVHIAPGLRATLLRSKGQLILSSGDMEEQRDAIIWIAKAHCRPILEARLRYWAEKLGVTYRQLRLNTARTRWGSCSAQGVINLSAFLLFAPMEAIDYVLIHELCHRVHFDHSPEFWAMVARACPGYQIQKQVLRQYQTEPFLLSLAEKEES